MKIRCFLFSIYLRCYKYYVDEPSNFSGLENGLERKELGKDMHVESVDVNDCSTKVVDKTSALESDFCDLENTGQKIGTNKNEHEEASCDDRPSPAAGEKMVSFITETNLQEDGDILLTQAAEENQNFFSEVNSGNVFLVSRGTCTHELLHGEETCLSAPEKDTDEGENGSAAIVPIQCKGALPTLAIFLFRPPDSIFLFMLSS